MDPFERFWNYSLKYLSYRPRSTKETIDALTRKKAPQEVIQTIITKLIELELLDDEKFAQWWVDQRTTFKPKGERVIRSELIQKGVPKEILDRVLSGSNSDETQTAIAAGLLNKRVYRYKNIPLKEMREKMFNFLVHHGFDFDIAKAAIDEVLGKGV